MILQTELHVATELDVRTFLCPWRDCHGGRQKIIDIIRRHHAAVGRDPFLLKSMIGGDPLGGYLASNVWIPNVAYDDDVVVEHHAQEQEVLDLLPDAPDIWKLPIQNEADAPLNEHHVVQRQVMEALDCGNALHREVCEGIDAMDYEDTDSDSRWIGGIVRTSNNAIAPWV